MGSSGCATQCTRGSGPLLLAYPRGTVVVRPISASASVPTWHLLSSGGGKRLDLASGSVLWGHPEEPAVGVWQVTLGFRSRPRLPDRVLE